MLEPRTISISGVPVTSYERDLPAGWSMIGSVNGGAVVAASGVPRLLSVDNLEWINLRYRYNIRGRKRLLGAGACSTHIRVELTRWQCRRNFFFFSKVFYVLCGSLLPSQVVSDIYG